MPKKLANPHKIRKSAIYLQNCNVYNVGISIFLCKCTIYLQMCNQKINEFAKNLQIHRINVLENLHRKSYFYFDLLQFICKSGQSLLSFINVNVNQKFLILLSMSFVNHTPNPKPKIGLKKDKNQLFGTAIKQPPGGFTNSAKYKKAS